MDVILWFWSKKDSFYLLCVFLKPHSLFWYFGAVFKSLQDTAQYDNHGLFEQYFFYDLSTSLFHRY